MRMRKGFTMIEFIAYVGVLVVLMIAFIQFVLAFIKNERAFAHRTRVAKEVDFVLRTMTDTLRTSKNINNDGIVPALSVFGKNGGDGNFSRVAFTRGGSNTNWFEVIWNAYGTTGAGNIQNGIVYTSTLGGKSKLTSPRVKVTAFRVDCIGSSTCATNPASPTQSVRITLQLIDITSGETLTATTSVTPRGFD